MFKNKQRVSLLVSLLFFSSFGALLAQPGSGPRFEVQPYVQALNGTSAAVLWKCGESEKASVEYGLTSSYGAVAEGQLQYRMKNGNPQPDRGSIACAKLADLLPGTLYHYRVVLSNGRAGEDRIFHTAPSGNDATFTFMVYGDSRSDPEAHARLISAASGVLKPDFVLHTGDIVPSDDSGPAVWMKQFFEPAAPLLRETGFFVSPGNHEEGNSLLPLYFKTPAGKEVEDCYSFDWGPVHITTVNTNRAYDPKSEQYRFLEKDLAGTSRPFKVFFGHHPTYSSSVHGDTEKMKRYLQPLFEKYGVQLVFAGHDHCYERSVVNGVTYIVAGGGGASLSGEARVIRDPRSVTFKEAYNFVQVSVTSGSLAVSAWTLDKTGAPSLADRDVIAPSVSNHKLDNK